MNNARMIYELPDGSIVARPAGVAFFAVPGEKYLRNEFDGVPQVSMTFKLHKACGQLGLYEYT